MARLSRAYNTKSVLLQIFKKVYIDRWNQISTRNTRCSQPILLQTLSKLVTLCPTSFCIFVLIANAYGKLWNCKSTEQCKPVTLNAITNAKLWHYKRNYECNAVKPQKQLLCNSVKPQKQCRYKVEQLQTNARKPSRHIHSTKTFGA